MEARTVASQHPGETRPASYRTFPRALAPTLTATGGALAALAGAGTWIRATSLAARGGVPETVTAVAGHAEPAGRAVIALGIITIVGALAWLASDPPLRTLPVLASLAVIGVAASQLVILDGRTARMVEEAGRDPAFLTFHAAFGWGAWMLLLASVVLFLGGLVGGLREADLRTLGSEVDA
jgi:hypothetical protein